jgi:creatinine amidohydrolase
MARPIDALYWANHTSKALAAMPRERLIAVLPVGAIEQHGPHLPLATDTAIVEGLVGAAARRLADTDLPVLFLPTQSVGKSDEHSRYPGTLTLSAETLIRLWTEIGDSVARAGLRKIVILNSHGGQVGPVEIVARDLRIRHGMLAVACNWFHLPLPEGMFTAEEMRFGIHAGDMETSLMLALAPDRVRMAEARDFSTAAMGYAAEFAELGRSPGARIGWQMHDLNAEGAAGNAAAATAARGAALIDAVAARLVALLADIDRYAMERLEGDPAW